MNNATITKIINEIKSMESSYSLGFKRLHCLPENTRKAFNLACFAEGISVNDIHNEQKQFLGSLSDSEFINWLKLNLKNN